MIVLPVMLPAIGVKWFQAIVLYALQMTLMRLLPEIYLLVSVRIRCLILHRMIVIVNYILLGIYYIYKFFFYLKSV